MAAQVLSGKGNVSYTNSTGQNVRIVINYLHSPPDGETTVSFQGIGITLRATQGVGKSLAWHRESGTGERGAPYYHFPTEIAISNGETFSITFGGTTSNGAYNIIIIPEAG